MKTTFLLATCIVLAGFELASAQSAQSNAQSAPPPAAVTKLIGKVELKPGQKLPFRLSFIDRKAFEEKRVTHPVPVGVRPDGSFEVPSLATLPEGYVLQSTPCIMPKAVTLAGVDILALHGNGHSPFGAAAWMANGGGSSLADMVRAMAEQVEAVRAGGVKWSGCGSKDAGGAQ
jgi:hypothetical protein